MLQEKRGTFQQYTYTGSNGSRPYFVYTPENYQVGTAVPLVVMLHGCTQTPLSFANDTQMNSLADQFNFIVVYPQQTRNYSQYVCWNWYHTAHHLRDSGEPAIIAGIVQAITNTPSQWTIDTRRVYVAGLSAGAAMTVILGATYPDIFAAIGVHSGLEYQAATNPTNGVKASRRGGPDPIQQGQIAYEVMGNLARIVPTIVFHGTNDYVNRPINGDQVVQQWIETNRLASNDTYIADFHNPTSTKVEQVPAGRSYTICTWNDSNGKEVQTYWKVNGMGHAWSGGRFNGSYTDPQGPDASLAMYRFFMDHPMMEAAVSEGEKPRVSLWGKVRGFFADLFHTKWFIRSVSTILVLLGELLFSSPSS